MSVVDTVVPQRCFVSPGEVVGRAERTTMRTMGVDISASRSRTAWAAIDWEADRAVVAEPIGGLDDERLIRRLSSADWIGIDGPFAWPRAMVEAVFGYMARDEWPLTGKEAFRYRETDLFVHERVLEETELKFWPMSVSSDRIGVTAWRVTGLRERAAEGSGVRFDRSGSDQVVEVHPTAALMMWGLSTSGYKKSGAADRRAGEGEARAALLAAIEVETPWLEWAPGARDACVESADALDAVLCALVARAASRGMTFEPPGGEEDAAVREGWIHLPRPGNLGALVEEE